MSRLKKTNRIGLLASVAALLVAFLACSVDTPTAPVQVPPPGPDTGPNAWRISVTVSPDVLSIGSDQPATVTARVESREDPGTFPPNGTTMVFSTSLGDFEASGSGLQSVAALISGGRAAALLFAGDIATTGTVEGRLQGSRGRDTFEVVSSLDPFITGVTPATGPASGGTQVTITGAGFAEPLRLFFGPKLATVSSVSNTQIQAVTPPGDLNTEACLTNNDETGFRELDTPVNVTIEGFDGGTETLPNAFTYLRSSDACQLGG